MGAFVCFSVVPQTCLRRQRAFIKAQTLHVQNLSTWTASLGTWQRPGELLFVVRKKATNSSRGVEPKIGID